jgi:glutamyl-tRNA reductase
VGESHLGEIGRSLIAAGTVSETVVLSTCNRVEFYAAATDPSVGHAHLLARLAEHYNDSATLRGESFFKLSGRDAIRHLFRVACGLDSMVIGETEILGQIKKAYQASQEARNTAKHLNKLFQRAFNVAKEIRTQTSITRGPVSVGSVAVDLAGQIFGELERCRIMILGAGEMAETTARALHSRGARSIFVSNRTYDRAVELATAMQGEAVLFDDWHKHFPCIDILIGSTASPHPVLTRTRLEPFMATRRDRPLFCIDLAVPRDIEHAVHEIEGVYLYDIDALQKIAEQGKEVRRQEVERCEAMIEKHVRGFSEWMTATRGADAGNSVRTQTCAGTTVSS